MRTSFTKLRIRIRALSNRLSGLLFTLSTTGRFALGSLAAITLLLAVGITLLAGRASSPAGAAAVLPPVVTIPADQEIFAPFIVTAQPHTSVTWMNADSVAHTVVTTPDHSAYLNPTPLALTVAPGKRASVTLTTPGVYDYYDAAEAAWNGDEHRVTARSGVRNFPLAMEGVIYVPGRLGGVPGAVTNLIPGKDEFATDFIAVQQGGFVAWYNADTDKHEIAQVTGWGATVNPASAPSVVVDGTDDAPPNGATTVAEYATPGLYYYYCSIHATVDTTWHRAVAIKQASEYPIPMEAFVLVVPR